MNNNYLSDFEELATSTNHGNRGNLYRYYNILHLISSINIVKRLFVIL